ncbi:hypothetical protein XENTR_v10008590 [Xenopus tropicalis]|nr:hypothetical protein XENTR_v10008590 [Xenopus tropicalis]
MSSDCRIFSIPAMSLTAVIFSPQKSTSDCLRRSPLRTHLGSKKHRLCLDFDCALTEVSGSCCMQQWVLLSHRKTQTKCVIMHVWQPFRGIQKYIGQYMATSD